MYDVHRGPVTSIYWNCHRVLIGSRRICYPLQYMSAWVFHHLLSSTVCIDRRSTASIDEAIYHCCVHCPRCGISIERSNYWLTSKNMLLHRLTSLDLTRENGRLQWAGKGGKAIVVHNIHFLLHPEHEQIQQYIYFLLRWICIGFDLSLSSSLFVFCSDLVGWRNPRDSIAPWHWRWKPWTVSLRCRRFLVEGCT